MELTNATKSQTRKEQLFARPASIASNLRHSPSAGNISQRLCDKDGIVISLLKACFQVSRHFFRSSKMRRDVVASHFCFPHHVLLQVACEAQGSFDIGGLCAFFTTYEKQFSNRDMPAR